MLKVKLILEIIITLGCGTCGNVKLLRTSQNCVIWLVYLSRSALYAALGRLLPQPVPILGPYRALSQPRRSCCARPIQGSVVRKLSNFICKFNLKNIIEGDRMAA